MFNFGWLEDFRALAGVQGQARLVAEANSVALRIAATHARWCRRISAAGRLVVAASADWNIPLEIRLDRDRRPIGSTAEAFWGAVAS
jgi:hypothetical protein